VLNSPTSFVLRRPFDRFVATPTLEPRTVKDLGNALRDCQAIGGIVLERHYVLTMSS